MVGHYTNLFFSIFLHILLLFTFLTIFFWSVIKNTESKSLYSELNSSIDSGLKNINIDDFLTNNVSSDIEEMIIKNKKMIKEYYDGYFSNEDITYKKNNEQLFKFNIIIIVLLVFGLLATLFVRYLICGSNINALEIIGENIFILIFVGIIEYYFFMNVASKYVPVQPSYMPSVVQNKINSL